MLMSRRAISFAPRSWMMFVDGENLTIRGQEVARTHQIALTSGKSYRPDVFVWFPGHPATPQLVFSSRDLQLQALRSYYYTSMVGDTDLVTAVRTALCDLGFHPEVFKKDKKSTKSKGVDITLAKDMLSHAYMGNYDVAVLVAGDGDYVPLVNEVKRLGKIVYVLFFGRTGLHQELRLASDMFFDIENYFVDRWKAEAQRLNRLPVE